MNDEFFDEMDDYEDYELDSVMGIDRLSLNFPAHVADLDGECFTYAVYFANEPGKEEVEAVEKAICDYDFQLIDDDYIGYTSVGSEYGRVSIYLDLGNTRPQNENKIIHGILLAMNNVPGITKVIINEM